MDVVLVEGGENCERAAGQYSTISSFGDAVRARDLVGSGDEDDARIIACQ